MTLGRWRFPSAGVIAAVLILGFGTYVSAIRFTHGIGAVSNLNDTTPWGLWTAFKLCAVALAAGGFTLTAMVHLFGQKRYHPILHSTVLMAFLGYLLFSACLIYDLGKPYNMWHVMIMWNPHSVMFEVAWCVMLYTTVLLLEFSPLVLKRLGLTRLVEFIHKLAIPLVLCGVLLSTLHQSSLGTMFLVVPGKLYKLWYTPYLPVMFFFSAVAVGFAMLIFQSYLSSYFFHKGLERNIMRALSRFLVLSTAFYVAIKFEDLFARHQMGALMEARLETYCFWLEILLLLPALLLVHGKMRENQNATFLCAVSVILGVMVNRHNVAIVGVYASSQALYIPAFYEAAIAVFLVTGGVAAFALAVKHLDIFENESAAHAGVEAPQRVLAE